jgi:predicted O-methyltransferase YrrM
MNTLASPSVRATLDRLHRSARADRWRLMRLAPRLVPSLLGVGRPDSARLSAQLKDVYIPVSREQGHLLYLVARSIDARRVVEFGTSFGISTTYLAAGVRDNGGGIVVGSELEPSKCEKARANLRDAGLDAVVDVRLGDALTTLADVEAPVDLVLLDGWKELYLPILRLLTPKLRPRAVVLADNIFTFRRALRPYVDHVQSGRNGFVSTTLPISDGFEYSVYVGA